MTTLHLACKEGHLNIVNTLLGVGVDIDRRTQTGKSALHVAAWHLHTEIFNILVRMGADVQEIQSSRRYIYRAVRQGDKQLVQSLINVGAQVNVPGSQNATAVFVASQSGSLAIVKMLIEAKADFHATTSRYYQSVLEVV